MRKKLLIMICAMLMLFGSALSVSASTVYADYFSKTLKSASSSTYYFKYVLSDLNTSYEELSQEVSLDAEYNDANVAIIVQEPDNYNSYIFGYFSYDIETETKTKLGDMSVKTNLTPQLIYPHDDNGNEVYALLYTNIPVLKLEDGMSIDEALKQYFVDGDMSGRLDDMYDGMETDDTFGLTGFTADNTITASWTGTTHDDVIDTYAQAKVGIRPGYAYKSAPGQIAVRSVVLQEYNIADMTFTKLYAELKHKDDSLFLRYLEVIPNYQKAPLSTMYVGKSCFIWLNADGSVEKIENELHDGEHGGGGSSRKRDYDFELLDVYCGTMPFNSDKRLVSWEESSKDDLIRNLGYENTYVSIFCEGVSSDGTTQKFDCTDSMMTITGKSPIRVHSSSYLMGDDFIVAITDLSSFIIENDSLYDFDGIIYIIPHYIRADVDYVGNTTMINLYTNDVSIVDDEDSDDEEDESGDDDEEEDDDSGSNPIDTPDIGGITDITDIFPYFLNLIKILINSIGVVPKFFSTIFPFLPLEIRYILSIGLVLALILRLIGR